MNLNARRSDGIDVFDMPVDLRQYRGTALWQEILRFRPQFEPGHEPGCRGITEDLRAFEATCPGCRGWLERLLVHGTVF